MRALAAFATLVSYALVARFALADSAALRWSRPIALDREGWTRVVLPDDVLAACRAGLPDLRVKSDGADVAFVLEEALAGLPTEWPVRDVESVPGRETTAVVDRGPRPLPASEVTVEIDAPDFLKPITLEASADARDWREIAHGSIFATSASRARARMTRVRFAPNDRRYFRLRLDDRNGPPIAPRAVLTGAASSDVSAVRVLPLAVRRVASDAGETTYAIDLPSANLAVSFMALAPADPAFVRPATVFERVLFRDEITRRVVGGGTVSRGPAGESLAIALGELRGPSLEIRISDGPSPPLALEKATVTIAPRSVLFYAPAGAHLTLDYGSSSLDAVRYDLAAALAHGRPSSVALAPLGDPLDRGASSPVGLPPHGAVLAEAGWQTKATIDLPSGAGVTYLPLDGIDSWRGLRVVDASSHEVPYVFEQTLHHARQTVSPTIARGAGKTLVTLSDLTAFRAIDGIELTATAPEYFRRSVSVVESVRDARGPVSERALGSAIWERRPGRARPHSPSRSRRPGRRRWTFASTTATTCRSRSGRSPSNGACAASTSCERPATRWRSSRGTRPPGSLRTIWRSLATRSSPRRPTPRRSNRRGTSLRRTPGPRSGSGRLSSPRASGSQRLSRARSSRRPVRSCPGPAPSLNARAADYRSAREVVRSLRRWEARVRSET